MADYKHTPSNDMAGDQPAKWTDSFPHSFHGWGPQTPVPDNELASNDDHIDLSPRDHLIWHPGRNGDGSHIVWRYDRTRH